MSSPRSAAGAPKDQMGDFVAAVLGNTEDTWTEIFKNSGQQYSVPRLRLFSGAMQGGCGFAQAAMGPFYCPNDRRIYLDTSFFRDMRERFRGCSGKACEFAEAYVMAHEVGHHVQNLLGILPKAQDAQRAAGSKAEANRIQVRVELQADCLAGVWAQSFQPALEFARAGRRRSSLADGGGDRRRPLAAAVARLRRAGRLHPRFVGAAAALVHDRPERGQGVGLQYVRRGFNLGNV